MLSERDRVRLSKKMAGLLRHYGPRYGLEIDGEGWARISDLVRVLRSMPGFEWVTEEHVREVVLRDDKGRYEIRGPLIRARYGHSIPGVRPSLPEAEVPLGKLYHGTPAANLESIRVRGLLPGRRHWVHLTTTPRLAYETGRRHGSPVAILEVDVSCLEGRGLRVRRASPHVYVVEWVPPECLRLVSIL